MNTFLQRHGGSVTGMLSGFDRVRFRGTLRLLANAGGMGAFLAHVGVLLKDFKQYVQDVTEQVRSATVALAEAAGRPLRFLARPADSKEDVARGIARADGVTEGLVCVLSSVEVLWSYDVHRSRQTKMLHLVPATRKCLHYYHYFIDPAWGFMHARIATWFPFTMHLCLNGREWLARQMGAAGIGYARRDNCFTRVDDLPAAQALLDAQPHVDWPAALGAVARRVNPAHRAIFRRCPVDYYWSADETEWASDVMFKGPAALASVYPSLVRHAVPGLGCRDTMRYLGKPVTAAGGVDRRFTGEVVNDLAERAEGTRVKHRVNRNAVKMYDKQGSVLRVETTVNDARDLRVYRPKEGDRTGKSRQWRVLRKGVADLGRRAEVSRRANDRYLEAMAAVTDTTPVGKLAAGVCRPVKWKGRRSRAINPLAADDAALLEAVSRGEFAVAGFRNRDLRERLFPGKAKATAPAARRRQSGAVTRKLRLLRAHGLVKKVPRTHRYQLTDRGRTTITALLAARQADAATLTKAA